ncbi:hypothetical protein M0R72_08840 [Candidatus Pacearchaeota archaeon]|jgi:hypothetical protein|nr:hypothetical protein [Candidatus Pacearchaeota archaeon]
MGRKSVKIEAKWDELSARITEEFMSPSLEYGPYVIVENRGGESRLLPADCRDLRDPEERITERRTGYYARLSASGYLDCTDYETIDSVDDVETFFDTWCEFTDEETD